MQPYVPVGSMTSWSQPLKCDRVYTLKTRATIQHGEIHFLLSISSDSQQRINGKFEYVVCLSLHHLTYVITIGALTFLAWSKIPQLVSKVLQMLDTYSYSRH